MSRYVLWSGALLLLLGLGGCSAPAPMRYYTLLAPSAQGNAHEAPVDFLIDVLPVGIPVQYEQPQLVVRQGDSDVRVLEGERWVSPMGDEVRNALSAALSERLGTQDIAGLPRPTDKAVVKIKLQVRRLDAWPGKRVQLDADWSLELASKAGGSRKVCRTQWDEPAPGGYAELVQAQQRAMHALARRIAAEARAWVASGQAACSV